MSDSKHEILRLMNRYCYTVDDGDLDGFAALFEHGTFELIGVEGGVLAGRRAVRDMLDNVILYDGRPLTKHLMSNVQIDVDDDAGTASAQCYITVMQAVPPDFPLQAVFCGHYHDRFERAGSGWRFVQRRVSPDLVGDLSRHRSDLA